MSNARKKEVRYYLMKALEYSYPYGASKRVLSDHLKSIGINLSPVGLEAQLTYLQQKEYITFKELRDDEINIKRTVAILTAKGVDHQEGNIDKDPGIGLE